jgi:uncharacterized membrane protein YoaK (UPF0700 family)
MPDDRPSPRVTTGSLRLGVLLSLTGGFLDAFTFLHHGGVFATAQTGNIVLIGVQAATGQWSAALRHVPALVAFVAGVATAETMLHPRVSPVVLRPRRAALVAELVVLAGVGALPRDVGSTAIVVLIAYVSAMQNAMFNTLRRWSANTVIATGNLSTATRAAYRALVLKEPGAAEQARSFGTICLSFLVGAIVGAFATRQLGNSAAWLAAGLVVAALALFVIDEAWVRRGRG